MTEPPTERVGTTFLPDEAPHRARLDVTLERTRVELGLWAGQEALELNARQVVLERRFLWWTRRRRIPLENIRWVVAAAGSLLIRTSGDEQLVWGLGEPQEVLEWVAAGVERAMRLRRQELDGDSPTAPPEELSELVRR